MPTSSKYVEELTVVMSGTKTKNWFILHGKFFDATIYSSFFMVEGRCPHQIFDCLLVNMTAANTVRG
jgi:hypothetical protein